MISPDLEQSGTFAHELAAQLESKHGVIMGSRALRSVLGFESAIAFQRAAKAKRLGILIFRLPGRKGYFAMAADVAKCLSRARGMASKKQKTKEGEETKSD